MDILSDLIYHGVVYVLAKLYEDFSEFLTGGMIETMSKALEILNSSYVSNATTVVQVIAGSLLAVRLGVEILQTNILHAYGEPTDPGGLLIRTATGAAAIGAGPWIIKTVYTWGTELATDLAKGNGFSVDDIEPYMAGNLYADSASLLMLLVGIVALLIWVLILLQTAVRSIELAVLSVAGPFMATGLVSVNKGLYAVWWRELLVISLSQASQIFLVKGALVSGGMVSFTYKPLEIIFFLAWLLVAYKVPGLLKQYAYSSGIGGIVGGAAQQAGTLYIMRKILTRGAA